jgi:hypothetical protein
MTSFITVDSGKRQEFETGAKRDTREGKGRFDLVSAIADHRLAGVYERGCGKYGPRNWEKGMPFSRFIDSAKRHINDYLMIANFQREGIPLDQLPDQINPDEDHLAQAVWNLFCVMHLQVTRPDLDDLSVKSEDKASQA